MRAGLLAALLLLPAIAGCLTASTDGVDTAAGALSQPIFAQMKQEQLMLAMRDGAKLDNWVFRPHAEGQFPVIIQSRPYFGNADPPASEGGQKFSKWLVEHFVPRGYVVVLHSIRGTGLSEGCYDQGGIVEQQDEAATVEAFAAMPYSNGKVAMIGKSYGGTTPWEAAVQQPPHLVTIVPVAGITRWYDYLWTNGASYNNGVDFNLDFTLGIQYDLPPGTAPPAFHNYPGKVACPRGVDLQVAGAQTVATGDETAWWKERDYAQDIAKVNEANISVYIVHGLQDWNVKPDQVSAIYNELTVPKRMWLGQMDHQYPLRDDWGDDLTRWFDHFLKGIDNGILDTPPVRVQDDEGVWREEDSWPPLRGATLTYQLGADGKLVRDAAKAGALSFVGAPTAAPKDGAPGSDRLVWTSAPLAADTRLAGVPVIMFNASFASANGQVAITLFEVNSTGWHAIDWAAGDARHHKGPDKPTDVPPGTSVPFTLRMYPLEHRLHAGSSVGIVIATTMRFTESGPLSPQTTIIAGQGATLTLPVVAEIPPESPQPTMMDAGALPWTS